MHASYDSNIDELFRALGWRKLKYQRLESAAVMMYKSLHGMTPEYLTSRFVFRNDITSSRVGHKLRVRGKTPNSLGNKSFLFQFSLDIFFKIGNVVFNSYQNNFMRFTPSIFYLVSFSLAMKIIQVSVKRVWIFMMLDPVVFKC